MNKTTLIIVPINNPKNRLLLLYIGGKNPVVLLQKMLKGSLFFPFSKVPLCWFVVCIELLSLNFSSGGNRLQLLVMKAGWVFSRLNESVGIVPFPPGFVFCPNFLCFSPIFPLISKLISLDMLNRIMLALVLACILKWK